MITEALSAFSALIFILALLALLAWAVKRVGLLPGMPRIKNSEKQIEVLESRILDTRNRLVVVKWRGREYLLATNPNGVTPLDTDKGDFVKLMEDYEKTDQ